MTQIFSQLGSHFSSRLFFWGGFMCKISPPRVNVQFHHIPTHQVFMYVPGRVGRTTHVESSKEPHFTFKKKKVVEARVSLPPFCCLFFPPVLRRHNVITSGPHVFRTRHLLCPARHKRGCVCGFLGLVQSASWSTWPFGRSCFATGPGGFPAWQGEALIRSEITGFSPDADSK